ncbi:hypothetical protein ACWFRB_19090 [Rhodococcus sp. NPDC055112]
MPPETNTDSDKVEVLHDDEPWYEVALVCLSVVAGMVAGIVLGWYVASWAVPTLQDLMHVPELSPIPDYDRAPGVPGPTAGYWIAWVIPPLAVYATCALVVWGWRPARWFIGPMLSSFTVLALLFVPMFILLDVGGFSPS